MSGKLEVIRGRLHYPSCDGCANEKHPSQLRQCVTCVEDGSPEFEFCEDCRIKCDDCGDTICREHTKGKVCHGCSMIGYESAAGDGGDDSAYRAQMIEAGRGHLLKGR